MHGLQSSLAVVGLGAIIVLSFGLVTYYARGRSARAQRSERERQRREFWGYE
jgi:hypothetical protein